MHIVGETWSGRAYELREVLEQCAATHSFSLAASGMGRELLAKAGPDVKLPLMVLPDGRVLSDPSNAEIAEVVGAPAELDQRDFDVVIVGSGPAGLSAAVYGASEGLRILVVDEAGIGGQARSSSLIRNYLGFPMGVSGSRLAEQAHQQAVAFGASFLFMHRATALARSGDQLTVSLEDGRRVSARAVILATGATYRRLDVPSLETLRGSGVFYGGPVSEAPALRGKDAYIAGGGNCSGQAALHLARYARRVTLVVRAPSLQTGMSHYLVQTIEATPNVEVRTGTTVVGGGGDRYLQHLVLRDSSGEEHTVAADALFVLIGARPHVDWLPCEIARDAYGFLLTGADLDGQDWPLERRPLAFETSMPGVLAAGDVRHASIKRVASAVGAGAIAVQLIHSLFADEPPDRDPRRRMFRHRRRVCCQLPRRLVSSIPMTDSAASEPEAGEPKTDARSAIGVWWRRLVADQALQKVWSIARVRQHELASLIEDVDGAHIEPGELGMRLDRASRLATEDLPADRALANELLDKLDSILPLVADEDRLVLMLESELERDETVLSAAARKRAPTCSPRPKAALNIGGNSSRFLPPRFASVTIASVKSGSRASSARTTSRGSAAFCFCFSSALPASRSSPLKPASGPTSSSHSSPVRSAAR